MEKKNVGFEYREAIENEILQILKENHLTVAEGKDILQLVKNHIEDRTEI